MTNNRMKTLNPGEIIPLTCDFMFCNIFNNEKNIGVLEYFLSYYLNIPYEEIKGNLIINKKELPLERKRIANRCVDLLLSYQRKKINIEMSNKYPKGNIDRNIVYICGIHGRQLKHGDKNYNQIDESIQINFNHFRCNETNILESYYFKNESGKILSKKIRVDFIDIVLSLEKCYNDNKLAKWCRLFLAKNEKDFKERMVELEMDEVTNNNLYSEVKRISSDDEYFELYTDLTHQEMLYNTWVDDSLREGIKQGLEEGKKQGLEEGKLKTQKQMAKMMLENGESLEKIIKYTNLSKEEIANL